MAMQRLKEAAEKAKIELSGMSQTSINQPYITADATGPKHLELTLTRAKFNELTADLVERTMGPVRQAMSDAGLSASDLSKVLLVGGSYPYPGCSGSSQGHHRQGRLQGHQPGRVRCDRRIHSGRRSRRRGQGRSAARRNPAVPRHRDPRRRMHQADRPQHHHPDQEEPGILHRGRQPAVC